MSWNCEFEKALDYFQRSIELSIAANNSVGISAAKSTMCITNYAFNGKIDLAYQQSKESLRLAEETDDIRNKGIAYSSYDSCCFYKGLFHESEKYLLQAVSFSEKTTHFVWAGWSCTCLGQPYFDNGEYKKAHDVHKKAISFL